jgi:hypothetical protein
MFLFGSIAAAAPGDAFIGDWVADTAHAPPHPVGMRIASLHIEGAGDELTVVESGATPDGTPYSLKFTANCDGRVSGIGSSPQANATQCWRNDPRTVVFKLIQNGTPVEWRTAEAAKNGQTLRITTTQTDARGKETKSVAVFLKK